MTDKIYIIIPIFKKANDIYSAVDDAITAVQCLGRDFEIVLLTDGKGANLDYIKKFNIDEQKIKIVERNPNIAPSQSLLDGLSYVSDGILLYVDPDMDLAPGQVKILFDELYKNSADIVVASKVHGSSKVKYSIPRKAGSFLYSAFIKLLFGVKIPDTRPELKLFRYSALKEIVRRMVTKEYGFDLEILVLAHKLGCKVIYAPVTVEFKANLRQIGFLSLYFTLVDTAAIFYRLKIIKFYDRIQEAPGEFPFVSVVIPVAKPDELLRKNLLACSQLNYSRTCSEIGCLYEIGSEDAGVGVEEALRRGQATQPQAEKITSLARSTYPNYEIIVLPDEEGFDFWDNKVRIIPTGKIYPSEKRDLGIKEARGEIIAFLDDDAIPASNWLLNAVKYFSNEKVAAVGGPAVTPDDNTLMQKAGGAVYASLLVAGFKNCRYIPQMPQEVDDYPSCNLFVRKDILEKIGGFQTNYWPGEDTILCLKITKDLKKKIIYSPDVVVYHHRRALFLPHLRQIKRYALHRGYFVKKFPRTSLRLPYFMPSLLLLWLILGAVVSFWSPVFALIYLSANFIYLTLVALTSLATTDPKLTLLVFLGIIFTHITYGFWFLKGLVSVKLKEG